MSNIEAFDRNWFFDYLSDVKKIKTEINQSKSPRVFSKKWCEIVGDQKNANVDVVRDRRGRCVAVAYSRRDWCMSLS